jgi:hypothetical protein
LDQDIKISRSAPAVEISSDQERWSAFQMPRGLAWVTSVEWTVVGTLTLLLVIGLGLRISQLGAIGFAEDEMKKLEAVRSYQRRDFSANAEHPMLMKLLMYGSIEGAATVQNTSGRPISDEAALRFPNAVFGALTVIPLFLLTTAFFDRWTGLLAAAFWAFGINAIALNRIGKEDTLLVFFMLFGFYFFLRAKLTSPVYSGPRKKNYVLSAASFGLMMASKYFPHYFGLNMLFHHNFHVRKAQPGEPTGKTPVWFYFLILVLLVVANPAMLLPQVWEYLNAYVGERLLIHSGYIFAGHLYKNNASSTPFWGTPIYFYALFLVIKMPLLIFAAFLAGLGVSIKRWRKPAYAFLIFMFLFWIVPYSLGGGKFLRYTLSLMPFVYMLAAVGVAALTRAAIVPFRKWKNAPVVLSTVAVLIFVAVPAWKAFASGPHYALYTNALAADKAGFFYPHDEFYDDGLREAIKFVCDTAPKGAVIAHETPAVATYYLGRFGRPDLSSHAMSSPDFDPAHLSQPGYFILQQGRTYFENQQKLAFIRANFKKIHEVRINGLLAAEIYATQQ